jgi:hypothetical protein
MNKYRVKCPGCDGVYVHWVIDGVSKLLHPGITWGGRREPLPTPMCVASLDYVYFSPCRHCCPERFADCPDCQPPDFGQPTSMPCRSDE